MDTTALMGDDSFGLRLGTSRNGMALKTQQQRPSWQRVMVVARPGRRARAQVEHDRGRSRDRETEKGGGRWAGLAGLGQGEEWARPREKEWVSAQRDGEEKFK